MCSWRLYDVPSMRSRWCVHCIKKFMPMSISMMRVACKPDLILATLNKFYRCEENLQKLLHIVQGKSRISLRLIDWFSTNYSKTHNVIYPLTLPQSEGGSKESQFIVYTSYKSLLRAYSKKHFDPFCRGENFEWEYSKSKPHLVTTVGQLNFFRWIIHNKILDYIFENLEAVEADMTASLKETQNLSSVDRKSRKAHSMRATRNVTRHYVTMEVDFGDP